MEKLRTRGKFLKKEEWYSICSRHYYYDKNCNACNMGRWSNVYLTKLSSLIYKIFPKFWVWYNN